MSYFDEVSKHKELSGALRLGRPQFLALQDTLLRLRYILAYGDPGRGLPSGNMHLTRENSGRVSRTASFGLGGKAEANARDLPLKLGLSASFGSSEEATKRTTAQIDADHRFVVPTNSIRTLLDQLVTQFGARTLIVLIDEWPLLGDAQVDFAEYIRRCFFGHPRLCIKLAADRYTFKLAGKNADGSTRGIELGADVFQAADLDMPLHGTEDSLPLYGEMLVKRLAHFEPEMYEHFGQSLFDQPMYIIDQLFHNQRAFGELCNGAQGLSRDFLELFNQCSNEIHCDARRKITYDNVHKVLLRDSQGVMTVVRSSVTASQIMTTLVMELVGRTQTPFFFTRKEAAVDSDDLRELLAKRVVHLLPGRQVEPSVDAEFDCYEVDYSVYSEWRDLIEWSKDVMPLDEMRKNLRKFTVERARGQLLDFPPSNGGGIQKLQCPCCNKYFSTEAPSFKIRRLCPHCFENAESKSCN